MTDTTMVSQDTEPSYDGSRWVINSLCDNDYYAFTMGNALYLKYHDDIATFRFINRGELLTKYIDLGELQLQLDHLTDLKVTAEEIDFLRKQKIFAESYLIDLGQATLPRPVASIEDGKLVIRAKGQHWLTAKLETLVLGIVETMASKARLIEAGISEAENDRVFLAKLKAKLAKLVKHKLVRFAEFGSRRRASLRHQCWAIEYTMRLAPGQLIGTSNVMLAMKYGIPVVGTMAHQLPMALAAKAIAEGVENPLAVAQNRQQELWQGVYGNKLSAVLTDTFTSRFFFANLTKEQAESWKTYRQDSGDPYTYGENLLKTFERLGVDPANHTMLCSDSLDFDKAIAISEFFEAKVDARSFGIGTFMTNDGIFPAFNIVWKLEKINDLPTVKLGDGKGKACGEPEVVRQYEDLSHSKETDEQFWARFSASADRVLTTAA